MKHYNIPIFLPELACPFRCVYCNQFSIAGKSTIPDVQAVDNIIKLHLASFPDAERDVEVAFFGGNFTGLPVKMQDEYLAVVGPYLENGTVNGIRCSTRPDYITKDRLLALKRAGMQHIELGAQSTDDNVLRACGRGHLFKDIEQASALILDQGFILGLQMMLGLPKSSAELDMKTAADIVRLGAKETRIYPCLVINDTQLEKQFRQGKYQPLSLEDAVEQAADVFSYFNANGVKVLRVGLHPSDELDNGAFVAGPYHHNFAEMVLGKVWRRRLSDIKTTGELLSVRVHPSQRTHAIGYKSENRKWLSERFRQVDFIADDRLSLSEFQYAVSSSVSTAPPLVIASSLMPASAKQKLMTIARTFWLEPTDFVYPSIAAHPDIYFFPFEDKLVFAPNTPQAWVAGLGKLGVRLIKGCKPLGHDHPDTCFYNAVGNANVLIHHLPFTDSRILNLYQNKPKLDVAQAYTRCNLIALDDSSFITSDKGIEKKLFEFGYDVLFIDPKQIRLEGHDYGFFPGCCGVMEQTLVVCGSTSALREKSALDCFLKKAGFGLVELYEGPLVDLGGLLFLKA